MQKQLGSSIELGTYTLAEGSIAKAVMKAKKRNPTFEMNEALGLNAEGESFAGPVKLYVWTYRHNYADTGLYQLYVSARGKMFIGTQWVEKEYPGEGYKMVHRDIQALGYEFGSNIHGQTPGGVIPVQQDVYADVEVWRGAVARVNARGVLEIVGNEAGVVTQDGRGVEVAPMSDWEVAPSLIGNWNYNPKDATGAPYWNPLDHRVVINENSLQLRPGDSRVHPEGALRTRALTTSPPYQPLRGSTRVKRSGFGNK